MKEDISSTICFVKDEVILCPIEQDQGANLEVNQAFLSTLITEADDSNVKLVLIKINLKDNFETNKK